MEVGGLKSGIRSGLYSCSHPGCAPRFPPKDGQAPSLHGGSNSHRERACGSKSAHSAQHAGPFKCFQVRIPIFPFASAGASMGSNFQGSWSSQESTEKEVQERWRGCQEERVPELVIFQN